MNIIEVFNHPVGSFFNMGELMVKLVGQEGTKSLYVSSYGQDTWGACTLNKTWILGDFELIRRAPMKAELIKCFEDAMLGKDNFIWILLRVPNCVELQIVVHPRGNFANDQSHYNGGYDDNLAHIFTKGLEVVDFGRVEQFEAIAGAISKE